MLNLTTITCRLVVGSQENYNMSMDYVHKGEAVKASTVNSIIEAIGGN